MSNILLGILAVTSTYIPVDPIDYVSEKLQAYAYVSVIPPLVAPKRYNLMSTQELKDMFHHEAPTLNEQVIAKAITSLQCANTINVDHNQILSIIDYSLPSSEKRLWVFDLQDKKLLYFTYVSHGIKSGTLHTNNFSNKYNSKASSIGIYKTEKSYFGREGLSLRLDGLERNFNDNASNRSVVMHGGWYVSEDFIKKYGRPGRSWGCPALPLDAYQPIINTIKDNSLLVVYYPSEDWFNKSKFLNCQKTAKSNAPELSKPIISESELRDDVLLADLKRPNKGAEGQAILAMPADRYMLTFHTKAPLGRMLRRQIDNMEYIALNTQELDTLTRDASSNKELLNQVNFVMPVIIMVRGYAETQMQIVNFGPIKEVRLDSAQGKHYTVVFEKQSPLTLRTTDKFIRWVGL